jgi:DNA-binding FadR family transcriptional regulator
MIDADRLVPMLHASDMRSGRSPMTTFDAFAPVEKITLAARVAEQLMTHIRNGSLQPGDPLPSQYKLAQKFGVSRPVLREAMQGLVTIGLIEIRPGSGCYVGSPGIPSDPDALFEIVTHEAALETLEARMVVEVELAALAAQRGIEQDWHAIASILEKLRAAAEADAETAAITSDFHRALARAAHNSVLYKMSQLLSRARAAQGVRIEQALPDVKSGEYASHLRLYQTVRDGNADAARREMRRHLEIAHGWEKRVSSLKTRLAVDPKACSPTR